MKKIISVIAEHLEVCLIIVCVIVILYLTRPNANKQLENNAGIARLELKIDSLNKKRDSIAIVEKVILQNKVINNIYHDSIKTVIYNMPDYPLFKRVLSEIARFDTMYYPSSGKGDSTRF